MKIDDEERLLLLLSSFDCDDDREDNSSLFYDSLLFNDFADSALVNSIDCSAL
jgi:hypothetical protein